MLAVEAAKLRPDARVAILSSAKTHWEIPWLWRALARLRLQQLLPARLLTWPNWLAYWFFGAETAADRRHLAGILRATDAAFLRWAIQAIGNWRNEFVPPGILHIQGDRDRILWRGCIAPTAAVTLPGGGHWMVVNRAAEVSRALAI
jgi:hypothetical protein